ncbi:MAG: M28 family peptidase [Chloracidobacterium sp.]|nr:M28 family peptidase [Chloracidobacterium sp.]MDW8218478.1 M28 family peptidase [Acidobacteriota bacterium]
MRLRLIRQDGRLGGALVALALLTACKPAPNPAVSPATAPVQPSATAAPRETTTPFDADRAFKHVEKQVSYGPRPAGSAALGKLRAWLVEELKSYGLKVTTQPFTATTPSKQFPTIRMENVIAELPGKSQDILLIASHYDTKYMEHETFVGANDAGSSTAVVLELARVLAAMSPEERGFAHTVQFVFFDGEEAVVEWIGDDNTYGSRHFVEQLQATGQTKRIKAMILLDMVGDADLAIPKEYQSSAWLANILHETAHELGYGAHFPKTTHAIADDHLPFLKAGIPAVDLIDFTYGKDEVNFGPGGPDNAYWHTARDTVDKLSPRSLKIVGDTVLRALPKIAKAAR